jgi:hypothetical protein
MAETVNTVTSSTGTASAIGESDTSFKVVHTGRNYKNGIYVYVNYDENGAGTVTLTFDVLNPLIHATSLYRLEQVAADGSVAAITFTLSAADGKFRLFLPLHSNETVLQVNAAIQTTTQTGILNIEFMED